MCLRVQLAFQHVASAARTAKLVQSVAEGEIENTEDPTFKANLTAAKDHVAQCTYDLCVYISLSMVVVRTQVVLHTFEIFMYV